MKKIIYCALFVGILLSACKKADPIIPNEEELITTLTYTLIPDSGDTAFFTFRDIDGNGGLIPVITIDTLKSNTSYNGVITLFDESQNPAENITEEIEEESADHQFFFSHGLKDSLSIEYLDLDNNGNPIGLNTTIETLGSGSDTLTIVLKHLPTKPNDGTSDNAGGETDIEVKFNIVIK